MAREARRVGGPRDAGHARPDRGDGRGLGSPSNVTLMAARLVADGYRAYTVNLDLLGIDTIGNANRMIKVDERTRARLAEWAAEHGAPIGGCVGELASAQCIDAAGQGRSAISHSRRCTDTA
ncbi:MAG TPA: hypothetical protein VK887_14245 [Pseudonocardiaceae bacterium]|nr:hypothetical protein [Pseudonocardiaceae bacterium]